MYLLALSEAAGVGEGDAEGRGEERGLGASKVEVVFEFGLSQWEDTLGLDHIAL